MSVNAGPAYYSNEDLKEKLKIIKDETSFIYKEGNHQDPKQNTNDYIHHLALKIFESGEENSFFIKHMYRSYTGVQTKNGENITRAEVYIFNRSQWRRGLKKIPYAIVEEPHWTLFIQDNIPMPKQTWEKIMDLFTRIPDGP